MAKLKPWYMVITPREDLREGKPLDASEFAVNLTDLPHPLRARAIGSREERCVGHHIVDAVCLAQRG
jgi:hypothetical protein